MQRGRQALLIATLLAALALTACGGTAAMPTDAREASRPPTTDGRDDRAGQ